LPVSAALCVNKDAMTVVPFNLREPLRKLKRLIGIFVVSIGVFVLLAMLAWLVAYFTERGFDMTALRTSFGSEFGYWSPVLIFSVSGLLMVFHGKRMIRNAPISLLESVEVLALMESMIAVGLFALPQSA
jgi:hypothetical protein